MAEAGVSRDRGRRQTAAPKKKGRFTFTSTTAAAYSTKASGCASEQKRETVAAPLRLRTQLEPDCRLELAAEIIAEMAREGLPIVSDAVKGAMWWVGIPETLYEVSLFTNSRRDDLAREAEHWLRAQADRGANRYGMALAQLTGAEQCVLVSIRSHVQLNPIPRAVKKKEKITLKGKVASGYKKVSVIVVEPIGTIHEPPVKGSGRSFEATFATGEKGNWQVEVIAHGARGPTGLANFPVAVGIPLKRTVDFSSRELESRDSGHLEKELFESLNRERKRRGLQRLEWDKKMGKVARDYSREMSQTGVIAHQSPISGSVGDRVSKAGIKPVLLTENLARAYSAQEAHEGLMGSPGHRANILDSRVSKVGIGVELIEDHGAWAIIVTQIFSGEGALSTKDYTGDEVFTLINATRQKRGRSVLAKDSRLNKAAVEMSEKCFGQTLPEPSLGASTFKSMRTISFKTNALEESVGEIDGLFSRRETHMGVGVHRGQDKKRAGELFCVVVLMGRR